jgi:uncharacterized damage-inducible protein DinB
MRRTIRFLTLQAVAAGVLALPAQAQQAGTLVADLLADIAQVQEKLTSLGRAIPVERWGWRPSDGTRTVGEVYLHVAADNYLLPTGLGAMAPVATGIKGDDYATVQAFEGKQLAKDAALMELERSFAHLRQALEAAASGPMGGNVSMFGQNFTRQSFLILTTTHLHEHLGQLIAYARSIGVVPPWSRG